MTRNIQNVIAELDSVDGTSDEFALQMKSISESVDFSSPENMYLWWEKLS